MNNNNSIFVAVHNEKRTIISGARGQAAFFDPASLRRSIGQSGLGYSAKGKGVKPKELYTVLELDITRDINDFLPKGSMVADAKE